MGDGQKVTMARVTDKERETLALVVEGLTNPQIAEKRGLSSETVKSELKRIFRKIGVENRVQAAVLAVRAGAC